MDRFAALTMEFSESLLKRRISSLLPARDSSGASGTSRNPDLSGLLNIPDDEQFLREAYRRILGRECDITGFVNYLELLKKHTPRRRIVHQIAASDEARLRGIRFDLPEAATPPRRGFPVFGRLAAKARELVRLAIYSRFDSIDHKLNFLLREVEFRTDTVAAKSDAAVAALSQKIDALAANIQELSHGRSILAGDILVTELDGFIVGLPAEEWRLAAYHAFRGAPEPGVVRRFREIVKPGMVVVDVGANIGLYTLYAARLLEGRGAVYGIEPTPRTFRILEDNVQVNGFRETGTVHLFQMAASDVEGAAQLRVYSDNCGHNNLFDRTADAGCIDVRTTSLDTLLSNERAVNLVKIDAEGAEPLIFRGMRRIVERSPLLRVILEFAPGHLSRAGVEPAAFLDELSAAGFDLRRIDDRTGDLLPVSRPELLAAFSANLELTREAPL